jgi:hypothetical protein
MPIPAIRPPLDRALKLLGSLLPSSRREWIRAMRAELEAITVPAERRRFALGALWGVTRLAVSGRDAPMRDWLTGIAAGGLITALDGHRSDECLLVALVIAAGMLFGSLAPTGAWRWIFSILGGLVIGAAVSPLPGFLDRTDISSLAPLLAVTVYTASLTRRLIMASRSIPSHA